MSLVSVRKIISLYIELTKVNVFFCFWGPFMPFTFIHLMLKAEIRSFVGFLLFFCRFLLFFGYLVCISVDVVRKLVVLGTYEKLSIFVERLSFICFCGACV